MPPATPCPTPPHRMFPPCSPAAGRDGAHRGDHALRPRATGLVPARAGAGRHQSIALWSKGQLVIPARMRQRQGLKAGDRLALSLEADGLRLIPQDPATTSFARALIGGTGTEHQRVGATAGERRSRPGRSRWCLSGKGCCVGPTHCRERQ